MRTYLIRRLLTFIPSMLVVYTLVFGMIHATPGTPWDTGNKPYPPQVPQNLEAKYHVNDPHVLAPVLVAITFGIPGSISR